MKNRQHYRWAWILVASALPVCLYGTDAAASTPRYTLYEVGGLGGGLSVFYNWDYTGGNFSPSALNSKGQLAGTSVFAADTSLAGSFLFTPGSGLELLPTLPNGTHFNGGSNANGVNDSGLAVGASAYGKISSYNNQQFYQAVSWSNGEATDLGDLGGHDSWANYVTNSGMIIGYAHNAIPDAYSYYGTQYHAVIWQPGLIDLGTLGGTDSEAWAGNDNGQVIGISALNTPPVPPFNQPQTDAFLWANGQMTDLGNLGGGFSTPSAINARGQVAVISFDASNAHIGSYVWTDGNKAVLPGLGGNFIEATALNNGGVVTGAASDSTDSNFQAAVWVPSAHSAVPLGTVAGDSGSIGLAINNHETVVGGSGSVSLTAAPSYTHAFIWRNGQMNDLNTLVAPGASLTLNVAYAITDSGIIAGLGTDTAGETHAFVLMPR